MAQDKRDVKRLSTSGEGVGVEFGRDNGRWYLKVWRRCMDWVDGRPRLGWYLGVLWAVDVVLHLLEWLT